MQQAERFGAYSMAHKLLGRSWLASRRPETTDGWPDMPRSYYFSDSICHWGPSRLTRAFLRDLAIDQIVARRRSNFERLAGALSDVDGVQPLFDSLPDGMCPLLFPVLVSNRQRWVEQLGKRGVAAIPWWSGYHRRLDWSGFPEARYLKDQLLALPLHQELDERHIEYIGECVRCIAKAKDGNGNGRWRRAG
jgi:hypothetical protein